MKKCPDFLHDGSDIPWINPECTGIRNQPPRAHLHSYENEEQAFKAEPLLSPYFHLLDGTWKFKLFSKPALLKPEFISQGLDDSSWNSIEVPGNWTMQGHDHPHYTNVQMPFSDQPPNIPEDNLGCTGFVFNFQENGKIAGCWFILVEWKVRFLFSAMVYEPVLERTVERQWNLI